jgi:hypothetical protein
MIIRGISRSPVGGYAMSDRPKKKPGPKPGPPRVALFLEIPEEIRVEMERLAALHDRKLTAECVLAFKEYIARQAKKGGGK